MTSHMRSGDEIAITLEEHRALTANRQRPLTDPAMSNDRAQALRAQQSAIASSVTDNVVDVVQRLVDARRARQKAS